MMKTIEGYTYKVNEHIGKGYSSTVHKGVNDKTGEEISIKVIEMVKLQDPINQMLLQYQVSALKNLVFSSNVLHLYDVYATKNNTYIITELCQGDLGSLLKQKKQFPYYEAVQILKQLISGYNDIHKVGFLHRDIKPANIFYKKGVYKIGDFGFAIPANQINQHKDYNVGSPVYMPPEALKSNLYGVSCDTWAIGIIFFQIIKGVVPWRAISEQKLHQKLVTEPLHTLTTGLPQIARSFLAEVLNLDPQKRMQPGQMASWVNKLGAVQIRSMSPYQPRRQNPLQEIKIVPQYQTNANNSTSNKVHSLSNNHQNNNSSNASSNGYSVSNVIPLNTRKQLVNVGGSNTPTINKINFFPKVQKVENGQNFFLNKQLKVPESRDHKQAESFAISYINYLKFIHRVIKFIGSPTKVALQELEESTIRHLFKQFQRIKKAKQPQNCYQLKIQNWNEFIKSQKGESFNRKLQKYEAKYKMFHVLSSEYPPEVYKQQILSGIFKLSTYLDQKQSNFSQKVVIALDYLITFYQLIQLKGRLELKQFLRSSKIDQIMNGSPYNVKREHLPQLKKKMQILGISFANQGLNNTGTSNLSNSPSNLNVLGNRANQNYNYAFNLNQIGQGISQISLIK